MTELWQLSATELVSLLKRRETPVQDVAQAHLHRLNAVNSKLNAIVVRLDEQGLAAAAAADRAAAAGDALPPLHGVPFRSRSASTSSAPQPQAGGSSWRTSTQLRTPLMWHG